MRKTIYILIGPQGSGKTHWAKNVLLAHDRTGIVRISQDEQGKGGYRQLFNQCLDEGVSVVVDRMNFNIEQRSRFTSPAYHLGYNIVYVWFDVDKKTCLQRLATRQGHQTISPDDDHDSMLDFYFDRFEPPFYNEHDEIFTIDKRGQCRMLDLQHQCNSKRVIVVGDIHGCYDEFMELLFKCEYRVGDIVVATGDLVDRGPKIIETLLWFRNTPGAYSVEGNHDNKLRRYWYGNPVKIINGLDRTIEQCGGLNPTEWAAWLKGFPLIIRLGDVDGKPFYVVHAGVDGRRPIEEQRADTCMYARYLDGSDFFDAKNGIHWWKTLDGSYGIASGHIISKNPHPCMNAYCLDGGAYEGGKLRGLIIQNGDCYIREVDC